jgi:membrane fusion protein (multidrug efflux system)
MDYHGNIRLSIFTLLILVVLSLLTGCDRQAKGNSNSGSTSDIPKVVIYEVHATPVILKTELPGRISPFLIAEIRPQVSGIIKARLFKEGADVKAGELLYQIDASIYQAEYVRSKAMLEKANANWVSAKIRNQRFQELAKLNAVSQQERDDAFALLKQAEADVSSGKANLQMAKINLAHTQVRAPISGRIGRSNITTGALVVEGQNDFMATIQQFNPVYVDLTQSTTELLQLKRSLANGALKSIEKNVAQVTLKFEDGSTYQQSGQLQFSDVTVDQSTGTVNLRVLFPNSQLELLPGMYVRAVIENGVRENGILVPQKAIVRDVTGAPSALILNSENKVEKRSVKTVSAMGDQWLLSEGLEPGDRLIIEGLQKVRPGQEVGIVSNPDSN